MAFLRLLIILGASVFALACASAPPARSSQASNDSGLMENSQGQTVIDSHDGDEFRARYFTKGMAALEDFSAEQDCDGVGAQVAVKAIQEQEALVVRFGTYRTLDFSAYEEVGRSQHQQLAFGVADEALRAQCLDMADQVYRRVVAFYIGAAYEDIRQRAKIGIDDVRTAREATPSDGASGSACDGNGTCNDGLVCGPDSTCAPPETD